MIHAPDSISLGTCLEEPIPTVGAITQLDAAGQVLIPGIKDLPEDDFAKSGLGETMLDFERLPEFLAQPLEAKVSGGEVVILAFNLDSGSVVRPVWASCHGPKRCP